MKIFLRRIDKKIRNRLRMCIWKSWKTINNRRLCLRKLGMSKSNAYKYGATSKKIARVAQSWILTTTITNKRLAQKGLVSAYDYYLK
jgi:hypothetical protein